MTIQDKYTRIFKSDNLTRLKYDELHGFAVLLRQHRNAVSELVCANLLKYLEYSKFDVMRLKMISSERQLIAGMCKALSSNGCGHVVMEDLDNGFGRCYVNDSDNSDVNYNRKVGFLGLSSLKQEFEHIARKYGIAVSTVQACYTSKMCPICGCIEDENRPDQETFACIECGRSCNADFNAAINIRNRVCEAVLRDALLKQLGNGAYEPRNLKREKVKEVLLSFRRSLQETAGSECSESGMAAFDYV